MSPFGPSDLRQITWARGYSGDSVMVYDAGYAELMVYGADGTVARTFAFETDFLPGMIVPHTVLPDGSILTMVGPSHLQRWQDGWWAVLGLLITSPTGVQARSMGTVLRHPCGQPVEDCASEPESYSGTWTAGELGVYAARPDRADVRWLGTDSTMILEGPESWASRSDTIPTYANLLIDPDRHVWAQSGDLARAAVFDPRGELTGTVELPPDLELLQVGQDFVVGVVAHEGRDRLQVHALRRTGATAPH